MARIHPESRGAAQWLLPCRGHRLILPPSENPGCSTVQRLLKRLSKPPLHYLNVAMDEDGHALEHIAGLRQIRRVPRVSLRVDIFQGDLATGFPVIRDEALGLVPQ